MHLWKKLRKKRVPMYEVRNREKSKFLQGLLRHFVSFFFSLSTIGNNWKTLIKEDTWLDLWCKKIALGAPLRMQSREYKDMVSDIDETGAFRLCWDLKKSVSEKSKRCRGDDKRQSAWA